MRELCRRARTRRGVTQPSLRITDFLLFTNNRDIGSHTEARDDKGVRRPCFPPCSDQRNKVSVTTSVFPNRNTFLAGPEFCLLFQEILP